MNDLISRQEVQEMVDRIGGMYPYRQIGNRESYSQYNEAWTDAISRVDAELNSLPSAQPERKKGEWIHKPDIYLDEQTWECSECGEPWIFIEGTPSENNANFCPYPAVLI